MILNDIGNNACDCWQWLENQYPHITLDQWIIMPNHLHGIIQINDVGVVRERPLRPKPLGRLVGAFKTISTKQINHYRNTPTAFVWQRNYYEHIIRNETDLQRIQHYIINNPGNWEKDEYY